MSFFGFGGKKEETILVLDIGSASVGGAIVKISSENEPEILATSRVPVNFLWDINFQAFWRCARNSLKKVLNHLAKESLERPDKILCVFSSPWFISQTRIISLKKNDPFEIKKGFLEKLIDDEVKTFKKRWKSETSRSGGEPEVFERNPMKVTLNGYPTRKPFGKRAKEMKAYIYMSLGMKKMVDEIRNIILENFGDRPILFHTLPFVISSVLDDVIHPEGGYIFADIGGEMSDISLVRDDVLEETVSFPFGRNSILRKISSEFKTSFKEASSLAEKFGSGRMDSSDTQKITPIMEAAKKEWTLLLRQALVELSGRGPLSKDFFLIGCKDDSLNLIDCVKDDFFSRFTILGSSFDVRQILPGALRHYFSFKKGLKNEGDVFLMMESFFADKIFK